MTEKEKAEHTPGPWLVSDTFPEKGEVDSLYGGVCVVLGFDNPDDETMPNAALIAAAPEMLAALKSAVHVLRQYRDYAEEMRAIGRGFYPTSPEGCTPDYFISSLEADIARAEGAKGLA